MAISYKVVDRDTRVNSTGSFGRLLEHVSNTMAEQNISAVNNKTFKDEIILDEAAWDMYKEALLNECDEQDRPVISDLLESTRIANIEGTMSILGEAVNALDVFTTFTFPLIRNIWPRTAMKYSAITTVVKKPTFNISYLMPQILKDGVLYDLNEITEGDAFSGFIYCPALYADIIKLDDFTLDGASVSGAGTVEGFDLIESVPGVAADRINGATIDTNLRIRAIEVISAEATTRVATSQDVQDGLAENVGDSIDVPQENKLITNLSISPDLRGYFSYDLSYKDKAGDTQADTIIGRVDYAEGRIFVKSMANKVVGIKVSGRLSPEFNIHTQSITYATRNDEFRIPIGAHLNAPVTQEMLADTQALFQIDGAAKIVEIMGEAFSQMLDLEYKENFIDEAYDGGGRLVITKSFDCKPIPTFMGSPADWRESLKTVINFCASYLKNESRFSGGKFVILGNDLDIDLITNVTWTFSGNTGAEKSGVATEYRIGAYAGLHNYEVVGVQKRIPQGAIYMVYLSEDDRQMTNRYFPYTFNVCESKYLDPNRPYVPNIMMSKRHLMHRFRNVIAKINIYNNSGNVNHFETVTYDENGNATGSSYPNP
jgi:hypothetical protein